MLWQLTKSLYGATKQTGKLLAEGMHQVEHGMEMLNEEMINYRYFDGEPSWFYRRQVYLSQAA